MMNNIRRWGRAVILSILVTQMILGYMQPVIVQAQLKPEPATSVLNAPQYTGHGVDESIKEYLCTPESGEPGTVLYDCIKKIYRFGVAFGAIALVFFIVLAGYFYLTGGESAKEKGKSIFLSALTGMVVILSSYVLLGFINPDLVKIKPIQPPIFSANDLPKCEDIGYGANCVLPDGQVYSAGGTTPQGERGQCTAANLSQCSKWNVNEAIAVCNVESKGYSQAKSGTDKCANIKGPDGDLLSFSYGIMQISLSSMGSTFPQCSGILNYPTGAELRQPGNCPGGFSSAQFGTSYCKARKCSAPKGEAILTQCVNLLYDVANNVKAACTLYGQSCWKQWPDTGKVVQDYKKCPR